MKLKIVALLLFLAIGTHAFSQNTEPEITVNLLANDKIADVNVNEETFIKSLGSIMDYCKNNFKTFPKTQKIGILVIVHKNGNPTYKCYSNPKFESSVESKILQELRAISIENTKIVDFPIFISINSSNKGIITDFEDYIDPVKQKMTDYKNADLQTKLKLNKEYAINEVLPVLTAYLINVDDKFAGVKNYGKLIHATNFNVSQNIDELTSKNKNYWRATMEMNVGNQIIPISKIFILVAQGELDYAKKYIEIIRFYSDPKTYSDGYLEEINDRIDMFNDDLNKEIEKGISEHDKGEYQKAINIYDEILKIYPNSSWTLYEKYFSKNSLDINENKITTTNRQNWDLAKGEIYKHNPLYNMDVIASNGKEVYLLFRRQEISKLFTKKDDRLKDVNTYADISVDLGVYDFAAQLYWLTATFDKKNSQTAINNYLYCLDKLGETELKSNFSGNFDKIFKEIEEERQNKMIKSDIYKSMEKK